MLPLIKPSQIQVKTCKLHIKIFQCKKKNQKDAQCDSLFAREIRSSKKLKMRKKKILKLKIKMMRWRA
jgi:hypothetical protein